MSVVALFGGPGGWEEGLRLLGWSRDVIGVEIDGWTCRTRHLAGHATIAADVAELDPDDRRLPVNVEGLIASPPCPLFSSAGRGYGRRAVDLLADGINAEFLKNIGGLTWPDVRPSLRTDIADLIEPLLPDDDDGQGAFTFDTVPDSRRARAERMAYEAALAVEPARWVMARRPLWVALEQVPPVLPLWERTADHLRHLGYSTWTGILNAADYGVPQTRRRAILIAHLTRPVHRPQPTHAKDGADGLPPWVSMADALGWDGITTGHATMRGAGMRDRHGPRPVPDETEPSQTITGKTRSWKLVERQTRGASRNADEPAMTITGSADNGNFQFLNTGRDWKPGGTRADAQTLAVDGPAPTLHKVNADDRRRLGQDEADARYGDRAGTDAVTLDVWQALALQTFRHDYPVQGPRSSAFLQVGNAMPVRLAEAVLRQLTNPRSTT